ncbi:hypothetical protein M569_15077 [Genlisea aurea]|uniref:Homeobox domain-containing protein n=1 Tax=Genlisea aurea TaxID=192259 RepID=S8BZ70_9LAMI|nr:hypothetical protein M569_15077 [Genlisea aurea]
MDGIYGEDDSFTPSDNLIIPAQYTADLPPPYDPMISYAADFRRRIPSGGCFQPSDHDQEDIQVPEMIKAKIASHPSYAKLLHAYVECQKVGAPPEIAWFLDEIRREKENCASTGEAISICVGMDPELDDFMESYHEILVKLKIDLTRPFDEATSFLNKIEAQLGNLCKEESRLTAASSDEDTSVGDQGGESGRRNQGGGLKESLLRRYGSEINRLKMEFSKKKKKGKLPKESRETLLQWWNLHYKWPYPTESDKIFLAESTGLDQKQINNWFINQRKRHWKPSENMQLAMMGNYSTDFLGEE